MVLSSIIPIPTELTITALLLSGKDRFTIFIILAMSSILAHYIGFSGNKFLKILYKKPRKKHEDKTAALVETYGYFFIHGYQSQEI